MTVISLLESIGCARDHDSDYKVKKQTKLYSFLESRR